MPFFIKIIAAPSDAFLGKKYPISEGQTLVGRAQDVCKIFLDGTKVSKKHCSLVLKNNMLTVKDLNSSNGVYVNGKKIDEQNLKEKDRLVIGEFTLEITVK